MKCSLQVVLAIGSVVAFLAMMVFFILGVFVWIVFCWRI